MAALGTLLHSLHIVASPLTHLCLTTMYSFLAVKEKYERRKLGTFIIAPSTEGFDLTSYGCFLTNCDVIRVERKTAEF